MKTSYQYSDTVYADFRKQSVTKKPTVLVDISNTQDSILTTKGKKKTNPKRTTRKTTTAAKKQTNDVIPHFDSFDDYELVVQSVTPIKTHVSLSTSTSDGAFDKFPTEELLKEIRLEKLQNDGPVASSPNIYNKDCLKHVHMDISRIALSNSIQQNSLYASPAVTRSASRTRNAQYPPVSMNTRRAKRIRERLGNNSLDNSLRTSTPEAKHSKVQSRYEQFTSDTDMFINLYGS